MIVLDALLVVVDKGAMQGTDVPDVDGLKNYE